MVHELDIAAAFRGSMLEWAARRARAHDRVWKERAMEQTCMLTKLSLAAGLVLAAATLAPAASAAAPQSPIPAVFAADGGLIQKAQWAGDTGAATLGGGSVRRAGVGVRRASSAAWRGMAAEEPRRTSRDGNAWLVRLCSEGSDRSWSSKGLDA